MQYRWKGLKGQSIIDDIIRQMDEYEREKQARKPPPPPKMEQGEMFDGATTSRPTIRKPKRK